MKIFSKKAKLSKPKKKSKDLKADLSNTIQDSRFQSVQYDPKFLPASKKISKTSIDSRFSDLFTDQRFKIVSKKDKYGRNIELPLENEEMNRLYYISEEPNPEEAQTSSPKPTKPQKEKSKNSKILKKKSSKLQKQQNPKETQEIQNKYYNEQGKFDWNEESSSDDGEASIEEPIENVWEEEDNKVIRSEASSSKLALLNYDWSNITSEDLMSLFNSLKPKNAIIKQIIVYPSEFGIKRMEQENQHGPTEVWEGETTEIINNTSKKNLQNKKKHKKVEKEINDWIAKVNKPTEFDPIKLRKYEKDRLKYYYAIIDCDNKETAEHIYTECDGTEFELSGMKIDLRFVPEDQIFPYEPKEKCDYMPVTNKVNNFLNRAMNHTNVELTWENPNTNRFDYLYNKNMTEEDWNKIDFSKILGEPDDEIISSEGDGIEEMSEKNEILEEKKDWRSDFDKKNRRKNEYDMEIKFTSGFTDIGNKIIEKNKEKEESTWEKYLKKRKEKKREKKLLEKKKMTEDDYFVEPEEIERDEKKYEDELKLLVDDEGKDKEFNVDVGDDRFKAIYEDSKYGINPTHKDFKVEGSGKYLKEVVDRRKKKPKNF